MRRTLALVVTASVATGMFVSEGHAALMLTINTLTADEFSFTLSGTFDMDVVGDQRQWLAVKNDWTNNFGQNVDWIDDSVGFALLEEANLTVIENSVRFNGLIPASSIVAADGRPWGDSFYFNAGFDITAGTTVSGTLTVGGPGIFDDSVMNLELLSGFDDANQDWVRLEARGVPGPMSALLLVMGAARVVARRRRSA